MPEVAYRRYMLDNLQGLIMAVLTVGFLIAKVWAIADCATRASDAFPAAGKRTKGFWLALTGVAAFTVLLGSPIGIFGLGGLIVALIYLLDVRPAVSEVTSWRR